MISILLVYFSLVLPTSVLAPTLHQLEHRPVVYVTESLVNWEYTPQNITVVIGVNNTVLWVSRSISYDTVTSGSGAFSSGPIPPGGSFAYTFLRPGNYPYSCLFHPWMTGTVTVVAR